MPLATGQILNNRYRIVRTLGEGGFGVVYRAWDMNMQSPVAIKENFDVSPQAQRQFQTEARLLFKLRHPNLPRVFDHFTIPGQGQYLVMDYIEGEDLEKKLVRQGGPLPEAQVLPWLAEVCAALEYLHGQNPPVIHRDIKPANIRITPQGSAILVDFGIAKTFDPSRKTTMGARAVTPGYSPPEQFGQGITDAQSDVYSLGATAYHLFTGQVPPSAMDVISGQASAPRPVWQLNPGLSPQLSALLEGAMQFNRGQRLASAAAFKAALPASAAPPIPKVSSTQAAPAPPAPAVAPVVQTYTAPAYAPSQADLAASASLSRPLHKTVAGIGLSVIGAGVLALLLIAYLAWRFVLSPQLSGSPRIITASNVAQLQEIARWGKGAMDEIAWSPDDKFIAVASSLGIYLFDAANLTEVRFIETDAWVGTVAFSHDSQTLASGSADNRIQLWRVSDGSLLRTLQGHTDRVTSVVFSSDDQMLASASWDYSVRLWRASDGSLLHTLLGHTDVTESVAFTPDGQVLASASSDDTVRLWRVSDGQMLNTLQPDAGNIYDVAFSPDGQMLASTSSKNIYLWQASDGALLHTLEGHTSTVESLAFSPDGQMLASASWDNSVNLWMLSDGTLLRSLEGHLSEVYSLAFSPDGQRLASASWDGSLRVWRAREGVQIAQMNILNGGICSLAFAHDNPSMAVALDDGNLLHWKFNGDLQVHIPMIQNETCSYMAAISPDGETLAAAYGEKFVGLWRASDGGLQHTLEANASRSKQVFSPDGRVLAAPTDSKNIGLWRVADGILLRTLEVGSTIFVFSSDSTMLAAPTGENDIGLWRASDGALLSTLQGHTESISDLAYSPDGSILASSANDKTVRLWRASDGYLLHTYTSDSGVSRLVFSPDGATLAVAAGKSILLLSASDGSLLHTLEGHTDSVILLSFSRNSDVLASAAGTISLNTPHDYTVHLWRASDGKLLNTLTAHRDGVLGLSFSPDGQYLATGAEDGTIRIWGLP
ncbi:MAG: serine/threonine-protein kinase [Chloroflexota bacterium]